MNFQEALLELKNGNHVARKGWNGKGMFLFYISGRTIPFDKFMEFKNGNSLAIEKAVSLGLHNPGDEVVIGGHIDMKAADGSIVVGWLASQTDMQADDWEIV